MHLHEEPQRLLKILIILDIHSAAVCRVERYERVFQFAREFERLRRLCFFLKKKICGLEFVLLPPQAGRIVSERA